MSATLEPELGRAREGKEGARHLTGRTRWTDDLILPGLLHLAALGSPVAHATITPIEPAGATEPGAGGGLGSIEVQHGGAR